VCCSTVQVGTSWHACHACHHRVGPTSPCCVGRRSQEEDIAAHFRQWGNVLDIYFPGKKGLKRVNYCFVTFDNWRAAQLACALSERAIRGRVRSHAARLAPR